MPHPEHQLNLDRLMDEISGGSAPNTPASGTARKIATNVPLSHVTSAATFSAVVASGQLLSQDELGYTSAAGGSSVEVELGTTNSIFLFAGPFSYPNADCGFLWKAEREQDTTVSGDATPFDSGGLVSIYTRPDMTETPNDFFERHRLPLHGHRVYLAEKLKRCCVTPACYLTTPSNIENAADCIVDNVVGLTGGDRRRWTHEVRINQSFGVEPQLLAVFLPRRAAKAMRGKLKAWQANGVKIEHYTMNDGDFKEMQERCIDWLQHNLEL